MKNRYTLWSLLLALTVHQVVAQAYDELDINDVRARFYAHGLVGYNYSANVAEFEVPQGSGTSALFSAGLWMGGYTNNTQLRQAAMMFEGAGAGDYYPGPLNNNGGTNASVMDQYNHVWSVTRQQIEAHIAYYQCLTDVNCDVSVEYPNGYLIPTEILEWPAINDNSGFNTYLAPFYDFNGDGDYQPTDGDAPCILGDKALYFVFNDVGGPHLLSGGLPLRAEVQAMPFAYSGAPYLDQTLFVHYHLVNRGSQTLTQARIGLFSDFDLGCANDDFIGSDPSRNLGYVYNWDEFDEDCNGSTGYGSQPPAFGQVLLKGPLLDANALDDPATNSLSAWNGQGFDDAIVDNERSGLDRFIYFNRENAFCCTDPETAQHYMSYLSGIWKDGTPMTYGGSGYSLDSNAIPCAFMYPGNTDPVGAGTNGQVQPAWAEIEQVTPDRRGLSSTAAFTLEPGEHVDLLFAYVFARAGSGDPVASVAALQARVDSVREFANSLPLWNNFEFQFQGACEGITTTAIAEAQSIGQFQLFPVPASDRVQLNATKEVAGELLTLHDATGRIVATHRITQGSNELNINSLAPGVYSCEVRSAYAHFTGRLVKE